MNNAQLKMVSHNIYYHSQKNIIKNLVPCIAYYYKNYISLQKQSQKFITDETRIQGPTQQEYD